MSIILLRGFSQSGKDYIGQILCDNYDYKRFAFADSLKKIVRKEFRCTWEQLHTQEGKQQICHNDALKRTFRQILIDEALRLRNVDINTFVNHCCNEIIGLNPEQIPDKIVITDWRYPNEIAVLEQTFPRYKIIPVHIQRINQNKSPVNDISEYQLDMRTNDYIINNNMDESIYNQVENLINFINNN